MYISYLTSYLLGVTLFAVTLSAQEAAPSPRELIAQGRATQALSLLRGDTSAEAHNLVCRAYYSEGKHDSAIPECEKAVAIEPNRSEYHLWLGRAYGQKAEASSFLTAANFAKKLRAEFEKAVELDTASVEARADLAEFYIEAPGFMGGGLDKARGQAAEMAKRDPAGAHALLSRIAEKEKNYDLAEKENLLAVKESSKPAVHLLNLASFYRRSGKIPQMEATIDQAIAADPKNSGALFDAATLLLRAGRNFELAVRLLKQYLASDAKAEDAPAFRAYTTLALLLEKQGKKAEAVSAFDAALALGDYAPAREGRERLLKTS